MVTKEVLIIRRKKNSIIRKFSTITGRALKFAGMEIMISSEISVTEKIKVGKKKRKSTPEKLTHRKNND